MADLVVEGKQLVVRLSWWEKIAALHGNVRVPIASVELTLEKDRSGDLIGRLREFDYPVASPVPLFESGYGVRRWGTHRAFVAVRRPRPAVEVLLYPPPSRFRGFRALLVTVADPKATMAHIEDAMLDHLRGAYPGWDIVVPSPPKIGWNAERPGELLHAATLDRLRALLDKRRDDGRR